MLLKWFEIIEFDEGIAQIAGEIFRQLKKEKLLIDYRDIFIGASAIFYKLSLATLNIKHFEKIQNLELLRLQ